MDGKVFWKRGLLLLMSLLVVLAMTATPAFAIVQGITLPGGRLTLPIFGVTLSAHTLNLDVGQTTTLAATVTPTTINTAVTWSSDTPSVATVSPGGLVTAVAAGTAKITAAADGYTDTCAVTVAEVTAATNTILPPGYAGVPTVNSAVTNAAGNTVILTFNEDMSSPPPGTAGFTVTVNGVGDTVTANALESDTAKLDLTLNTAAQYGDTVAIAYAGSSMKSYNSVQSKVNGVQVYGYYMLQGFSGMTVTNNVPNYTSNTSMALPIWVSLNTNTLSLTVGATATLTATTGTAIATPGATNSPVTWSTDNLYTATVTNGLVTANAPGTAIITATSASGKTATCTVTVAGELTMAANGVALNTNTLSLTVGATATLTSTVTPSASNSPVNWSSDNPIVATVNNGLVTAVAPGTANITAITEYVPHTATCAVIVTAAIGTIPVVPPHLQGIQVYVNGTLVPMDVAPKNVDGSILVQMRPIFNALGAALQWDSADKSIAATEGNTTIKLQVGSTTAYINGAPFTLATAPMIVNDHTMIPCRFVSKAFGYKVKYDAADKQVDITGSS